MCCTSRLLLDEVAVINLVIFKPQPSLVEGAGSLIGSLFPFYQLWRQKFIRPELLSQAVVYGQQFLFTNLMGLLCLPFVVVDIREIGLEGLSLFI